MLDPRVAKYGPTVTSRVFLHFLSEMECPLEVVEKRIIDTVGSHMGLRGSEVIKLCIDEIERLLKDLKRALKGLVRR